MTLMTFKTVVGGIAFVPSPDLVIRSPVILVPGLGPSAHDQGKVSGHAVEHIAIQTANSLSSAKSDVSQRCGPRRSPRSVAVEEVRPEVGLPPVTAGPRAFVCYGGQLLSVWSGAGHPRSEPWNL
jgi:hypothetical protein